METKMKVQLGILAAAAAMLLGVAGTDALAQVNTNIGSGTQSNSAAAVSGVTSSAQQGNAQSLTINNPPIPTETTTTLKNVPGVAAPGLATTLTETCMGSTSVGGAGVGFGVSFGTTWRDTACVRRLDSRRISELGQNDIAFELMCDSDAVRAAAKRVGRPCVADREQPAVPSKPAAAVRDGKSNVVKFGK